MTAPPTEISFEKDIRPLFRQRDRDTMVQVAQLDLWSYDIVRDHAEAILGVLESGRMPCDGAWPPERVDVFRQWTTSGTAP